MLLHNQYVKSDILINQWNGAYTFVVDILNKYLLQNTTKKLKWILCGIKMCKFGEQVSLRYYKCMNKPTNEQKCVIFKFPGATEL